MLLLQVVKTSGKHVTVRFRSESLLLAVVTQVYEESADVASMYSCMQISVKIIAQIRMTYEFC